MSPKITVLSEFDWLMLADNDQNQIPHQELNSEPLSLHCPARNQPETVSAAQVNALAA